MCCLCVLAHRNKEKSGRITFHKSSLRLSTTARQDSVFFCIFFCCYFCQFFLNWVWFLVSVFRIHFNFTCMCVYRPMVKGALQIVVRWEELSFECTAGVTRHHKTSTSVGAITCQGTVWPAKWNEWSGRDTLALPPSDSLVLEVPESGHCNASQCTIQQPYHRHNNDQGQTRDNQY